MSIYPIVEVNNGDSVVPLAVDTFWISTSQGLRQCTVRLSEKCLSYRITKDERICQPRKERVNRIPIEDIIGCRNEDNSDVSKTSNAPAALSVFEYFKRTNGKKVRTSHKRKAYTFVISKFNKWEDNYKCAEEWKQLIEKMINPTTKRRTLLFIVNPFGGKRKALTIFDKSVKPLLVDSGTRFDLLVTERAQHAYNWVRNADLFAYDGIVVVSGDGLLYEVVNGVMQRSDAPEIMSTVPFGIIPGGSGNGLAHSINSAYYKRLALNNSDSNLAQDMVFDCAMHCIRGFASPMDIVRVTTKKGTVLYSFLSIGWGLMADVDIESERLRALGAARFTIYAIYRTLMLRKYNARLSFLPFNASPNAIVPSLNDPVPANSEWIIVEGQFVQIYCSYQSHIGADTIFAPDAKFDDGVIWLSFLRGDVSKKDVLRFLVALEEGQHTTLDFANVVKVRAFRLEPVNHSGNLTIDGELIDCEPIQAEVMPKLARILAR